jgi:uncharacterized membrane protein (UPF0127 family)
VRSCLAALLLAGSLAPLGACDRTTPSSAHRLGRVAVETPQGALTLWVELADTEPLMLRGLMQRQHLDADAGMLFMFAHDRPHSFWMKDTLIPLDMLFLGPDGTVRSVVERDPLDLTGTDGGVPSVYVLEVNRGWARAHGITPGHRLRISTGS